MAELDLFENGRGAFTSVGKDNGEDYYSFVKGSPLDGSSPEKGFNYEAVNLGVKSIEDRLVALGYSVKVDGIYGPKVKAAVRSFQKSNGLSVDGRVGRITGPLLFREVIASVATSYSFDPALVYGIMKMESGGDPGAVGWLTPGDRGLFQFNTLVHDITYQQAHDYDWATETMFFRFNRAWSDYKGKGPDLRINCSILQHKSPVAADQWFETGVSPGPVSEDYVSKVRAFARTY